MASDVAKQEMEDQSRAKVFISYSRKDMAFADRLEAALKARGFEPLLDRTDILAFEEWWKRVQALIGRADTIVFVLSPDAVRPGTVALKEVAFAASLNKRFAPIIFRPVEDKSVPEELAKLNFIFFDHPDGFEQSADELAEALNTDIAWIRLHTEFGEAARRWVLANRPNGLLLRSPVLEQAERWIAARPNTAPAPTEETQTFIRRSRQAATRRRNILTGSLAAGLVLALVLAGIAYWQRGIAVEQEKLAQEQRDLAENQRIATLAELATSERLGGNWDTALRLSTHAARLSVAFDRNGVESSGPRAALATAVWQSDLRLTLKGHEEILRSANFDPKGERIITASDDKTARLWDTNTGKQVAVLRGHDDFVLSGNFSPDGSLIVTASADKTARIWQAASGLQIAVLGHKQWVHSAVFSPDGSLILTASADNTARIWNAETAKEMIVFRGHEETVLSAAFSPDVSRIVTASSDKTARIWNTATGKEIAVLRGHAGDVSSAVFSSDGSSILTVSWDGTARIWDAANGKEIKILRLESTPLNSAAFSPDDSRIVTASTDGTVRIWSVATTKEIRRLRGSTKEVYSVVFSPDGLRVLTASWDKTARIWDAGPFKATIPFEDPDWTLSSTAFNISPDWTRIVTAQRGVGGERVHVWDASTGKEVSVLVGHEIAVQSAAFSPDGLRIVTGAKDQTARVWNAATGRQIVILRGHQNFVTFAAFSPDGSRIVTASWDETARIWDAVTGKQDGLLRGHRDIVNSAVFSPDGSRIVTASQDFTARIWEASTGKEIMVLNHGRNPVHSAVFSPNGKLIVTASFPAHIWDTATGNEIATLQDNVTSAAFSPDSSLLVTGSRDYTARIWDAKTGRQIAVYGTGRGAKGLPFVAFSPDTSRIIATSDIAASSDDTVLIWDVHFATMSAKELVMEVCSRRMRAFGTLSRDEMRLAGYPDTTPKIDVCAGIE